MPPNLFMLRLLAHPHIFQLHSVPCSCDNTQGDAKQNRAKLIWAPYHIICQCFNVYVLLEGGHSVKNKVQQKNDNTAAYVPHLQTVHMYRVRIKLPIDKYTTGLIVAALLKVPWSCFLFSKWGYESSMDTCVQSGSDNTCSFQIMEFFFTVCNPKCVCSRMKIWSTHTLKDINQTNTQREER